MDNDDAENSDPNLGPPRLTRLDPKTDELLLAAAAEEERPIAQVIRRIVREHFDKRGRAA